MFLLRILPGILKEFVKHVPTVLFEVIDWNELAAELPKLSKRLIQKEGYHNILQSQKSVLAPLDVVLKETPFTTQSIPKEKWVAEKLISIYFAQIFSPHGLFLDLKLAHFNYQNSLMEWNPSSLWIKFDDSFSLGMQEIYEGFYLENDEIFRQGLKRTGLLSEKWSISDQNELTNLFKSHFGASVHDEITFNVETFKESMSKISEFMLRRKVKITKDFLYLGIYLVSLYSSLEFISTPINVRDIYLKTRKLAKPD